MVIVRRVASVWLALLSLSAVAAQPMAARNLGPFAAIFGLPHPTSTRAHQPGSFARISLVNNFLPRHAGQEQLVLDGESLWLETGFTRSQGECWHYTLTVPFIRHSGGWVDSFVNGWHAFFNLPESGRPDVENDRLLYYYAIDDDEIIRLEDPSSGVGDIRVELAAAPGCTPLANTQLRIGLKLATGDPDRLFGSGGHDFFMDVSRDTGISASGFSLGITGGMLFTEQSKLFSNQRHAIAYTTLSLDWRAWRTVLLQAQLTAHSAFFDSDISELNDAAFIATLGGEITLPKRLTLELGLSEDPVYGTSPDVVFHLGIRYHSD